SGGLTIANVTPQQVAIRGDAAIVERLRGNDEKTREYLTYTGAGHMPDMKWISGYEGDAPVCGLDGGAGPEDSVVIEIAINEAGHVEGALPIYASRSGELGVAFAQKVNGWRWNPIALKNVNGFWRSTLRLEMRCASRPEPERLSAPYRTAAWRWLAARGALIGEAPEKIYAANDPRLTGRYGRAASILFGPASGEIAALDAELDAVDAPPAAHALLIGAVANQRGNHGYGPRVAAGARAASYARLVPAFRQRFPAARAGAWLDLEWALALEDSGQFAAAVPRLEAVLATPEAILPQDDPVRSVALLHAALVGMRGGDPGQARARLAASGLGAEQCALFDTHPVPSSMAIGSSQFPMEALHWHFEGYVQEAYDIGPDGHVVNVRTVLAYPPFVFGPSTEKAVRQFRYLPPSIDGKPVGCNGETQAINYRIPG
ncbi:MAG: hypothetical protein JWO65_1185, partial [Sphingomonas bacterium]|nr:hypothetical protein [Sphingomonas bacterium]